MRKVIGGSPGLPRIHNFLEIPTANLHILNTNDMWAHSKWQSGGGFWRSDRCGCWGSLLSCRGRGRSSPLTLPFSSCAISSKRSKLCLLVSRCHLRGFIRGCGCLSTGSGKHLLLQLNLLKHPENTSTLRCYLPKESTYFV